jgi:hypothetical protein
MLGTHSWVLPAKWLCTTTPEAASWLATVSHLLHHMQVFRSFALAHHAAGVGEAVLRAPGGASIVVDAGVFVENIVISKNLSIYRCSTQEPSPLPNSKQFHWQSLFIAANARGCSKDGKTLRTSCHVSSDARQLRLCC